jgi:hypothetical protein
VPARLQQRRTTCQTCSSWAGCCLSLASEDPERSWALTEAHEAVALVLLCCSAGCLLWAPIQHQGCGVVPVWGGNGLLFASTLPVKPMVVAWNKSRPKHNLSWDMPAVTPHVTELSLLLCFTLCRNLGDNRALCGYLPNGLGANTQNTGIGTACSSQPAQTPPPPATPTPAPPSPATAPPSGVVTLPDGSPTPPVVASPNPSPAAEPEAKPAPAPTVISSAPICSCALRGFGSQDCTGSLANVCRGSNPPAVSDNATGSLPAAGTDLSLVSVLGLIVLSCLQCYAVACNTISA